MKIQAISSYRPMRRSQNLNNNRVSFGAKVKGYTGWLEIPSCNKDSEGYCDNVGTLGRYKSNSWDLDKDTAMLLWGGDFHIFLKDDKAQVGISYQDIDGKNKDVVKKIYIDRKDKTIPVDCLNEVKSHINDRPVDESAEELIEKSDKIQEIANNILTRSIDEYTTEEKLNAFGIETALDENGKFILSEYRQPAPGVSFEDIGIDEDELLKNVSVVFGNADFTNSKATSLGSLKVIGGNITAINHNLKDLGELAHIGGDRNCDDSNFNITVDLRYGIW